MVSDPMGKSISRQSQELKKPVKIASINGVLGISAVGNTNPIDPVEYVHTL